MKIPGFLFLDEPEKRLDNPETLQKMIEFVKEMQKETKRQIFVISHKKEFVDSIPNPIIIKAIQKRISTEIKEKPIKKKRGRPRKKKEKLNAKK